MPRIPSVLFLGSWPSAKLPRHLPARRRKLSLQQNVLFYSPALTAMYDCLMFLNAPSISQMATSAVASSTAIGVLDTAIPRLVQAATSMLLYPAPLWQMNFKLFGSASTSSALKSPVIGFESLLRYSANKLSNSPLLHLEMKSSRLPSGYSYSFDATCAQSCHSFCVCVSLPMRRAALCDMMAEFKRVYWY
jgi:hypothetical protein